ncbi:hypothetical protein GC197_06660 [bacterium]|nr:hypothetical protein [bacterium]
MNEQLVLEFEVNWEGEPVVGSHGILNVQIETPTALPFEDDRQLKVVVTTNHLGIEPDFANIPMREDVKHKLDFALTAEKGGQAHFTVAVFFGADLIVSADGEFPVKKGRSNRSVA